MIFKLKLGKDYVVMYYAVVWQYVVCMLCVLCAVKFNKKCICWCRDLIVFYMFRNRGFIFRKTLVYRWYGIVCFTCIIISSLVGRRLLIYLENVHFVALYCITIKKNILTGC